MHVIYQQAIFSATNFNSHFYFILVWYLLLWTPCLYVSFKPFKFDSILIMAIITCSKTLFPCFAVKTVHINKYFKSLKF